MKDIKDYIHLYLGCECIDENGERGWFSGFDVCERDYSITMISMRYQGRDDDFAVFNDNEECDRIKLLLRPLSDITEEEKKEIEAMEQNNTSYPTMAYALAPHFVYLLSRGFDIFGLIDAGLALDKTKL